MGLEVLRELVMTLGLDVDEASFAVGNLAAEGLKKVFEGLVDLAKEAVHGFHEMVASTAEEAHNIEELSQRTGIATETLQQFGYAAGMSNVSLEDLAIGLGHLAKTGVKDLRTGLLDLADRFADMPDGGAKTALAIDKFGRAGSRLIPFLNRGKDGIAELADEADRLGIVMDETMIDQGAEYVTAQKRLNGALTGLKYTIAGPLLEGATKTLGVFKGLVLSLRQLYIASKEYWGYLKAALVVVSSILLGAALRALSAYVASLFVAGGAAEAFGLASILAGARAAGAAVLAMAPWAGLAGLIILIVDEIYTTLIGGDTLITRYGEKWTHALDIWTRGDPDDWWVLKALKAALHALSDLQGTWEEFKKTFSGSSNGGKLDFTDAQGNKTGESGQKGGFFSYLKESVFGPPTAPTGLTAGGGSSSQFNATINVQGGSASPADTAAAVRKTLDDWHRTIVSQALTATAEH